MTLTVGVDTIGTIIEADSYFAGRPFATVWTALPSNDPKKESSMRMAFRHLGGLYLWKGTITSLTQVGWYPRTGVVDDEGRTIADNAYPTGIKEAQFELAAQWVAADQLTPLAAYLTASDPDGGAQVKRKELGPLKKEYFENASLMFSLASSRMEKLYPLVDMLVAPYILRRKNSSEINLII